jgi:nucleoside 2-deoxyribosyltransferase
MKRKVFISGPIQGFEHKQSYRDAIREICVNCGYGVFDPWEREKVIYKSEEPNWWEKVPTADFIKRDLEDIERCDVLIAYLPTLSAGTCMELFYAKLKDKITICLCQLKNPSPWITFHSDIIIRDVEELKDALDNALKRNAF